MIYLKICSWSFHLVSAGASYINQRILITCLFGESILHVSPFEFISISSTPRVVIMITHYSFAFSGIYQDQCQNLKLYLLLSGNYNECLSYYVGFVMQVTKNLFRRQSSLQTSEIFCLLRRYIWFGRCFSSYFTWTQVCCGIIWTHFLFSILSWWSCAFATKETIGY